MLKIQVKFQPVWSIYTKYGVEILILTIAGSSIGFLWKFVPDILPFLATRQIELLYCIKIVSCLLVVQLALGSYIIYLRQHPKYNALSQQEHEDMQRRKLGAFLLDEIDRLKKERQSLIKRPPSESALVFSQYKEDGRFLDGQDEALLRFSQWLKPPEL